MKTMAQVAHDRIAGARMRIETLLRADPSGPSLEGAADFIADVRHWCDGRGIKFDDVVEQGAVAYHGDYGEAPPPPAVRVLDAIAAARASMIRSGIPPSLIERIEGAIQDGVNDYISEQAPRERPAEAAFLQSVADVARDSWTNALLKAVRRGAAPDEAVGEIAERIRAGGVYGPAREGACAALRDFCADHGVADDAVRSLEFSRDEPTKRAAAARRSKPGMGLC